MYMNTFTRLTEHGIFLHVLADVAYLVVLGCYQNSGWRLLRGT